MNPHAMRSGERACAGVVVFDFNWSGHIPAYHRMCVEAACRAGLERVTSLSGHADQVRREVLAAYPPAAATLHTPACPELGQPPVRETKLRLLHWIPGGRALFRRIRVQGHLRRKRALLRWSACGRLLRQLPVPPALVFFPYLDDMLEPGLTVEQIDGALGGHRWAGIYMDASDLRSPRSRPRVLKRLHLLRAQRCAGVGVIDDGTVDALRGALPGKVVHFVPDAAEPSLAATEPPELTRLKCMAHGRKIVSLLGHLNEAKNLELFLRIATAPEQRDLFFLIAGQFEPLGVTARVRRSLEAAAAGRWENVLALPHRLRSEGDFNALVAASDVLFAVYRDFTRSSNMLSKAAQWGRPVLVAGGYCMAERVRKYGLGEVVDQDDRAACIAAMRRLAGEPPSAGGIARFAGDFSVSRFQHELIALLNEALASHA